MLTSREKIENSRKSKQKATKSLFQNKLSFKTDVCLPVSIQCIKVEVKKRTTLSSASVHTLIYVTTKYRL